MKSKRAARGENAIDRVGISWRMNTSTGKPTCVVEMRPPKSGWRLHFGSYPTEHEAMIARDYAAFLRHSAGETGTSAGGFNVEGRLYEFEESPVIFESMETSKVRRDEYKRLHTTLQESWWQDQLQSGGGSGGFKPKPPGGNSPYKELCKAARDDIAVAMKEFRRRRPDLWPVECRTTKGKESHCISVDLTSPSSSFEVIGSSKSVQSPSMADDKQKVRSLDAPDQIKFGADHEYPGKEIMFSSSIGTSNYLSSSPGGKSSHVTRGFKVKDDTPPLIKEDSSKHKVKEDAKSLLQVELEKHKSLEPCQEGFNKEALRVLSTVAGTPSCEHGMSSVSITCSGVPGSSTSTINYSYSGVLGSSFSAGTSMDDETAGLSINNSNNDHQEFMPQIEEQCLAEPEEVFHIQILPNQSHVEMGVQVADHNDRDRVEKECHIDQTVSPDTVAWWNMIEDENLLEDQTAMDIDENNNMFSHKWLRISPSSSNFEVIGSSKSVQSPSVADDKQKVRSLDAPDQIKFGADHEYPGKEIMFSSSIGTSNYLSSSPGGKSSHVTRGFKVKDDTPPLIKEDSSKHKVKEDAKSLLQVELEKHKSLEPCQEGFNKEALRVLSTVAGTPSCEHGMSSVSITCSGVPGSSTSTINYSYSGVLGSSFSAGTSMDDETAGLSINNSNNDHQEFMPQIEEQCLAEPEEVFHIQILPNQSHVEMGVQVADHNDRDRVEKECHIDQTVSPDTVAWWNMIEDENLLEDQTAMDIDEEVKMDMQVQPSITSPRKCDNVPQESKCAPSHMLATTPKSTVEVGRAVSKVEVLKKVVSKVASNKARSKAEMVEKRVKSSSSLARGYSAAAAHTQALFAARLESEKVKLDTEVQRNNQVKIANLTTAKDNGVISYEEYTEQVKALLPL